LDLGCGNGWLAHHLAALHEVAVYGVDLNQAELAQAARVFAGQPRLHFVYADVFTAAWPAQMCDLIIVASAIQYFPDLPALVRRLLALLTPRGEVHLLDSPLYHPAEAPAAQARTRAYYAGLGCADMAAAYHHHTFTELAPFAPELLYNPAAALNRFARRLGAARSPFPWLRLKAPA
jgi:ubiquinone/menaquinone biosynthesis C-methylase UbiE